MPLFKVHVTTEVIVQAKDEDAAVQWLSETQEWVDPGDFDMDAREVKTLLDIPHAWRDALPWGDCKDDRDTCEKLLVAQLDPSAPPSDVLVPGGRDVP
jgi:hypothetical protein